MKKGLYIVILLFITLAGFPQKAKAYHNFGSEITYRWLHDSTYRIYYILYRDCVGIPRRDSLQLCYSNSCGTVDTTVFMYIATGSLPYGAINGEETYTSCPGHPTTCDGGTIPGYRKWWYSRDIILNGHCDHWKFSASDDMRHPGIRNIIIDHGYSTTDSQYVEATLDNLDAQGNSSVIFTENEFPFLCINDPYTSNNGAIDIDNDSLYYEYINPMTGDVCNGRDEVYAPGYSLPSNPLACDSTFKFDNTTGTESFTPDSAGLYAQLVRVDEYRKYQTSGGYVWKKIGSAMRECDLVILNCNAPPPTLTVDSNSFNNATYSSGEVGACTLSPFSFCFAVKSGKFGATLQVTDNGSILSTTTHPSVSYSNMFTDSVRGCVSWTPGPFDTGLHSLIVRITDTSQCKGIGIAMPVENVVYAIPFYIWPSTKIFKDTLICPGDTVRLRVVGGSSFSWTAVPGGSGPTSLSCASCPSPFVHPSLTTQYAVYAANNKRCANRDTVTISTLPEPDNKHIDTALCSGSITLSVPVASVGPGISKAIRWFPALYLSSITSANPVYTPGVSERYAVSIIYAGKSRCETVDTVDVKVLKLFDLSLYDTTVCSGVHLQVRASGDTDFDYTWMPVAGVSDPKKLTPIITADTTTTYTLTSKHANCPDSSTSFTIMVEPNPKVNAGNDTAICQGARFALDASVSPAYSYTYSWSPGYAVDGSSALSPMFISDSSIRLMLTASTAAGCKDSDDVWIKVNPAPYFSLGKDTLVCHIDQLQVGNMNNQRTDIRYRWSTGDTSCCIIVNTNGIYVLNETDSINCSYTDSIGVYFSNCLHCIAVPNAFSPNNDGIDDEFKPVLMCPLKQYDLKIFNRWGQEVFHSQSVNYGWDGKYKGELMGGLVDKSVFVYIIELTEDSPGAEKALLKGNITVIR